MAIDEPRIRGLRAVEESRVARRRALVLGKVQLRGDASRFWLWTFVIFIAFGLIYWRVAEGQLESQKSALMSKQRAVAKALGPTLVPFRDRVEKWAVSLGTGVWKGDQVAPGVDVEKLSKTPGVYLRLRRGDATSGEIEKAAVRSLHDGFTSCLFVRKGKGRPAEGKPCRSPSHCEKGELCNEWNVCSPPTQPYNMRLAYRALRVLSSKWTDEVHQASTDIAVRVFEHDLEKVSTEDVPIAVDLFTRAKYASIVLDEDPDTGFEPPTGEEESEETALQKLQRLPHFARIGIWSMETGEPLLLARFLADAKIVPVGKRVVDDETVRRAQQRQANSCSLAMAVREALGKAAVTAQPDEIDEANAQANEVATEAAGSASESARKAGIPTPSSAPKPAPSAASAQ